MDFFECYSRRRFVADSFRLIYRTLKDLFYTSDKKKSFSRKPISLEIVWLLLQWTRISYTSGFFLKFREETISIPFSSISLLNPLSTLLMLPTFTRFTQYYSSTPSKSTGLKFIPHVLLHDTKFYFPRWHILFSYVILSCIRHPVCILYVNNFQWSAHSLLWGIPHLGVGNFGSLWIDDGIVTSKCVNNWNWNKRMRGLILHEEILAQVRDLQPQARVLKFSAVISGLLAFFSRGYTY